MQFPRIPRRSRPRVASSGVVSAAVALAVAAVLGGYTLALGFTGIPVLVAAASGMIAGLVLARALAR